MLKNTAAFFMGQMVVTHLPPICHAQQDFCKGFDTHLVCIVCFLDGILSTKLEFIEFHFTCLRHICTHLHPYATHLYTFTHICNVSKISMGIYVYICIEFAVRICNALHCKSHSPHCKWPISQLGSVEQMRAHKSGPRTCLERILHLIGLWSRSGSGL